MALLPALISQEWGRGMMQAFLKIWMSLHTPHGAQSSWFLNSLLRNLGVEEDTLILSVLRPVLLPSNSPRSEDSGKVFLQKHL